MGLRVVPSSDDVADGVFPARNEGAEVIRNEVVLTPAKKEGAEVIHDEVILPLLIQ